MLAHDTRPDSRVPGSVTVRLSIRRVAVRRLAASVQAHGTLLRAARSLALWRFRLFQRHRHRRTALERVDNLPLLILPQVFNPVLFRTGEMLARYVSGLALPPQTRILDLGCGSGVVSIFAAREGAQVVAVDINPEAVRCTRINALMHGLESSIEAREGDLFGPVRGERFDLVLFNPPYFRGHAHARWEHAWRSEDVMERFAAELRSVLADHGQAILILSTVARGALETLEGPGLSVRTLAERQLLTERLSIVEVRP